MKPKPKTQKTPGLFVVINLGRGLENFIAKDKNPTKIHPTLESAMTESFRLAGANIGNRFAVFSCAGFTAAAHPQVRWRKMSKADIGKPTP